MQVSVAYAKSPCFWLPASGTDCRTINMKKVISWTARMPDGVKRETRVRVDMHSIKWQFKRADQDRWDYDSTPCAADWDMLEDILHRRAGRGRSVNVVAAVKKMRARAGV